MSSSSTQFPNSVFVKTAKGRDEIAQRGNELNPRQRRVLIMIDGSRDLDALAVLIPEQELADAITFLAERQYIETSAEVHKKPQLVALKKPESADSPAAEPVVKHAPPLLVLAAVKPEAAPADNGLTNDPATIRQVKDFMTTTAQTYLGLLGSDVIQRIERAKDAAQLMSVVGHWHMALHDSKQGGRFAAPYLEQVKTSLRVSESVRLQA